MFYLVASPSALKELLTLDPKSVWKLAFRLYRMDRLRTARTPPEIIEHYYNDKKFGGEVGTVAGFRFIESGRR